MGFLGLPLGYIMYWIFKLINSYGWSLIFFVLLTKLILLPLTIKQQKSTAKMASFQPKLKELEKQCGKDKQKYQQEMMKLYEKEGISPTAGCLPMLIQFALLFGIVDVIYNPLKHLIRMPADLIKQAVEAMGGMTSSVQIKIISAVQEGTNPELLKIIPQDILGRIQEFDMNFMGIDFGAVPQFGFNLLMLIPILSGITGLIMTLISMKQQERNGQKMQGAMKYMMYFSPVISVWIGFTLPAGVGFYWILSNIIQILQTYFIGKIYTPEKLATMKDSSSEKNKEKMRKKREKMEAYNKLMIEQGKAPVAGYAVPDENKGKKADDKTNSTSVAGADLTGMKEKDLAKLKLAQARKRMAEKYGDEYSDE